MKLVYRGVTYEQPSKTVKIREGRIAGKWRGQNWRYHYPRKITKTD